LINPERRIASEDVVFHAICSSAMLVLLILRLGQIAKLSQARAADLDHSRDELRRAHERVTAMFESAPIGMADPEGHILAVNGALTEFTGQPAAALVNATITRFVNPNDIALVMGLVAHTLHDHDGAHSTEIRSIHPDADPRIAEWGASPLRGSDDSDAVIVVIADRTHARRLEVELRHSQKREGIGRLAAGVAHVINTPIQFIGDNVNFLADTTTRLMDAYQAAPRPGVDRDALAALDAELETDYLSQEIPEAVRQTIDGVHRVATIVQALKSFAHPSTPVHLPADLNQSLTDTLTIARNELVNIAEIRTNLGVLPPVMCSIGDLNQVFLNLLLNAADALSHTEPAIITVSSRAEGDEVVIEISDNGMAIPQELQEKIFEPFFTTKAVGQGTGQGLALARTLVVDRHGGTIDCTSHPWARHHVHHSTPDRRPNPAQSGRRHGHHSNRSVARGVLPRGSQDREPRTHCHPCHRNMFSSRRWLEVMDPEILDRVDVVFGDVRSDHGAPAGGRRRGLPPGRPRLDPILLRRTEILCGHQPDRHGERPRRGARLPDPTIGAHLHQRNLRHRAHRAYQRAAPTPGAVAVCGLEDRRRQAGRVVPPQLRGTRGNSRSASTPFAHGSPPARSSPPTQARRARSDAGLHLRHRRSAGVRALGTAPASAGVSPICPTWTF
jgi:PAS domain S-box-containing protein